ncbi:MAG TPA: hypothetical protein VF420_15715 [Casimicrobiaceae bacterium]
MSLIVAILAKRLAKRFASLPSAPWTVKALLDEPTGGLNPAEIDLACELVRRIRDSGVTVILIEHHMKAIMRIADRVIVLHHGVKIADAAPPEIVRHPEVIKAYLGEQAA